MSFRAADAYDRHIGRYSAELGRALIAAAGAAPGMRALDVGCGPGGLTAELVARLGADHVTAVDPSEPFAGACRRRLPGVDVRVAGAESLPFDDGAFDVALAQLVLNFVPDPEAGLRELARVTRGTVAVAVWDYGGEMTLLRRFWDAAVALDPAAEARDERHMPFCTREALRARFDHVEPAVVSAAYDDFEDLWAPLEAGVGPSGAYVVELDRARRAAFKAEFQCRLDVGDGPFRLTARAWIGTLAA
jgi:ubiquinone/menaquinone biosynthesis C-methylase UbiE